MCSNLDQGVDSVIRRSYIAEAGKCVKCKDGDPVITVRQSPYCRVCFLSAMEGKFRISLAKAFKHTQEGEDSVVILALSGGVSSRAMLDLFHRVSSLGSQHRRHKRRVIVCFVDPGSSAASSSSNYGINAEYVIDESCKYGYECALLSFDDAWNSFEGGDEQLYLEMLDGQLSLSLNIPSQSSNARADNVQLLMHAIQSASARRDIQSIITHQLLIDFALSKGSRYIILGDTSTRAAIKSFSLTASGRGGTLPVEAGSESLISGRGVHFIKPMTTVTIKEAAMYARFMHLDTLPVSLDIGGDCARGGGGRKELSIDDVAESFLVGIDAEYPMTVSTIVRTVSKLKSPRVASGDPHFCCIVCACLLLHDDISYYTRNIIIDRLPSDDVHENGAQERTINEVGKHMCLGCHSIFTKEFNDGIFELPCYSTSIFRRNVGTRKFGDEAGR